MRLLVVGSLAVVLGACATEPTEPTKVADGAKVTDEAPARKDCLRETGTRIQHKDGRCTVTGTVITNEALQRSGAQNLGDAIRRATGKLR